MACAIEKAVEHAHVQTLSETAGPEKEGDLKVVLQKRFQETCLVHIVGLFGANLGKVRNTIRHLEAHDATSSAKSPHWPACIP